MVKLTIKPKGIQIRENEPITSKDLEHLCPTVTSHSLEVIHPSLKNLYQVDATKVAHFKAEIDAGNYKINSNALAKKMANTLELA